MITQTTSNSETKQITRPNQESALMRIWQSSANPNMPSLSHHRAIFHRNAIGYGYTEDQVDTFLASQQLCS